MRRPGRRPKSNGVSTESGESPSDHAGERKAKSASANVDSDTNAVAGRAVKQREHGATKPPYGSAAQRAATASTNSIQTSSRNESTKEHAGECSGEAATGETGSETSGEKIAGVNPESWPPVALAIALSLLVTALVCWRRGRWFAAALAFAVAFAGGDAREFVHQVHESRTTVATIAAVLIALHLLAAVLAGWALWLRRAQAQPAPKST